MKTTSKRKSACNSLSARLHTYFTRTYSAFVKFGINLIKLKILISEKNLVLKKCIFFSSSLLMLTAFHLLIMTSSIIF
jgi:hypothetical protein